MTIKQPPKRKRGRPVGTGKGLDAYFQVRITPAEYDSWTIAANTGGQKVSQWLRDLANEAVKRTPG